MEFVFFYLKLVNSYSVNTVQNTSRYIGIREAFNYLGYVTAYLKYYTYN